MLAAAAASALLPLAASMSAETAPMWAELESHCAAGLCEVAEGSKLGQMANTTDCKGRMLAYEFGLKLIPARAPQRQPLSTRSIDSFAPYSFLADRACVRAARRAPCRGRAERRRGAWTADERAACSVARPRLWQKGA